jgi:hypothetical protein
MSQRRIPVVTTFHGSDTGYIPWQAKISWIVSRATTPVFVAEDGARRLGISAPTVIPVGVDSAVFQPKDRALAREELGWPIADTILLLPGARSKAVKGAALFDAVCDLLREDGLRVHGVALEGFPRETVPTVMNAVDALVMTSLSEGSPVSVKEALATETPVVSVDVGDVAKVIDRLPGCSIAPRDARRIAERVISALDYSRGGSLRLRARDYDRRHIASRLIETYEALR